MVRLIARRASRTQLAHSCNRCKDGVRFEDEMMSTTNAIHKHHHQHITLESSSTKGGIPTSSNRALRGARIASRHQHITLESSFKKGGIPTSSNRALGGARITSHHQHITLDSIKAPARGQRQQVREQQGQRFTVPGSDSDPSSIPRGRRHKGLLEHLRDEALQGCVDQVFKGDLLTKFDILQVHFSLEVGRRREPRC